jgi:imidazolonepropionase
MLLTNATLATLSGDAPYGLLRDGAVLLEGDRIIWVGLAADAPPHTGETLDLAGGWSRRG